MKASTKKCIWCNKTKPTNEFLKRKSKKNNRTGHQSYCIECGRKYKRKRRERIAKEEGRFLQPYKRKQFSSAKLKDHELLEYLTKFQKINNRPPSTEDLQSNPDYPNYYTYYRKFIWNDKYKDIWNWNSLIAYCGMNPLDYDKLWKGWEYLVDIIVSKFFEDCIYQYHLHKGYRPDIIIPSQNLIIDAALSNYVSGHKQKQYDIAKSLGYSIEYWCLYKTSESGLGYDDLTYVFADEIIKRLEATGDIKLAKQIDQLIINTDKAFRKIIKYKKKLYSKKIKQMNTELGRTPTIRDFLGRPNYPSSTSIVNIFGSFNKALEYSKFPVNQEKTEPHDPLIAENEIINFAKKLNRIPTLREIGPPNTTYTNKVYRKYYGGIQQLLESNGIFLKTKKEVDKQKTDVKSINQLVEFYKDHQRIPKQKELRKKNNLPSPHWIRDNIGSYKELENLIDGFIDE